MSGSTGLLARYRDAVDAGRSVLVCPATPYDGLDATIGHVTKLSAGQLVVTDLRDRWSEVAIEDDGTEADDDDPLLAFHTSGSTGSPKVVVYRRSVVEGHARAIAERLGLVDDGTTYVALPPPGFAYGLSIVHSHHVTDVPVQFVAPEWGLPGLQIEGSGEVAIYVLPQHAPLLAGGLTHAGIDAERVTRFLVAGGRLSAAAARTLGATYPRATLTNMYGQAELGPRLTTWHGRPEEFVEGTIGRPLPGVDIDVVDGELHARTPFAMSWCIRPPYTSVEPGPGSDPVATRDRGTRLEDGTWRHDGRADHVLNVAGTKVDLQVVRALVEEVCEPLAVRISSRRARVGGDAVPVVQIVPGETRVGVGAVRRALHAEFGSMAALCDIRFVERLEVGESGK